MAQPIRRDVRLRPGLVPPAVQRAQVQRAVGGGLHAAGAAGLHGAQGRVQPDVARPAPGSGRRAMSYSSRKTSRRRNSLRRASATICWMSSLPASSRGWALPAKMTCTGRRGVVQDRVQALRVAQQQGRPLVGGEPAREADGQRVRIEHLVGGLDLRSGRRPRRSSWPRELAAGERHQPLPPPLVAAPEFLGGDGLGPLPERPGREAPRASPGPGSGRRAGSSRTRSRSGNGRRWSRG